MIHTLYQHSTSTSPRNMLLSKEALKNKKRRSAGSSKYPLQGPGRHCSTAAYGLRKVLLQLTKHRPPQRAALWVGAKRKQTTDALL